MLAIKPQFSLKDAREYFKENLSVGDYYTQGQHVPGHWFGQGAEDLGLTGVTRMDKFVRLCENLHPQTGEKLTMRQKTTRIEIGADGKEHISANRRVFYDFTFSPAKSVSIAALVGDDPRIVEAHEQAVNEALRQLQSFASTRVRKKGECTDRLTGNIVAAVFQHETSRALDPHLHSHCILFNATLDVYKRQPLLYEGRLVLQQVDQQAIDKWFEVVTKPLSDAQRTDLKRKFASADQLNKADRKVYEAAFDISEHFSQNWQGTGFKAQLAAPNKATALKYKKYLDEFGKVTSEVVISAPDTRDEQEDVYEVDTEEVRAFWKKMMVKYGTEKQYLEQVINAFKHGPEPEILIVVSKLLTGFDAPKNTVLYLCRSFEEHNLLQAIARVNRLSGGKDFGFIMDYFGVLQKLGEAMDIYSALPGFEKDEIAGTVTDVAEEIKSLPQKHSELWDVFKTVKGSKDKEKYERLLGDEEERGKFYEKLNAYYGTLGIALSTMQFLRDTPEKKIQGYKDDLAFFLKLRVAVKQRYAEEVDYKDYEKKVQKLIDTHVRSEGIQQVTTPVNIFERDAFKKEVDKLESAASKADTIAHRTQRTITDKMDEDPVFYRRFGKILQESIDDYRANRINEMEYLNKVTEIMESVLGRTGDKLPDILHNRDVAKALYGVVNEVFEGLELKEDSVPYKTANEAADMAVQIDEAIQKRLRVDWRMNPDVQNEMRNAIDDLLYETRAKKGLPLSVQDMDTIIERALEIAKNRYPR